MGHPHPPATAHIGGHPLHPALIPLPLTFFIAAFATDLAYVFTRDAAWATGSKWVLIAGIATAALAALAGFADFIGSSRIRAIKLAWAHMIGNIAAVLLELFNLLIRLEGREVDALEPLGVVLSGAAFAILGFTGWAGGELVFRHGVAVVDRRSEDRPVEEDRRREV